MGLSLDLILEFQCPIKCAGSYHDKSCIKIIPHLFSAKAGAQFCTASVIKWIHVCKFGVCLGSGFSDEGPVKQSIAKAGTQLCTTVKWSHVCELGVSVLGLGSTMRGW